MDIKELESTVEQARRTVTQGDIVCRRLSSMLIGRLKVSQVPSHVLYELKKELRDFNMTTYTWKEK